MRSIDEILDAVKERHAIGSDYKLAAYLGVGDTNIRSYRKRRSLPDATMCLRIAAALGEDPLPLIAEIEAQRAATPETAHLWRTMWDRLAHPTTAKIAVGFAAVLGALTLGGTDSAAVVGMLSSAIDVSADRIESLILFGAPALALIAWRGYTIWRRPTRAIRPVE